jgi:uncharacterized protein (UPF0264 family)
VPQVPFICLDVANGYTEVFVEHVRRVREAHPTKTIIAGGFSPAHRLPAPILMLSICVYVCMCIYVCMHTGCEQGMWSLGK